MTVREALAELEYGIAQRRSAISLLHCLGKGMQQDEVTMPNIDEAILGVYDLMNFLLERDEAALENALAAARGEI